jgi:hypothetical protein
MALATRFDIELPPDTFKSSGSNLPLPINGVFSSRLPWFSTLAETSSTESSSSMAFSLSTSSLELLLTSVDPAKLKALPYEFVREGAGVCGGDTRAERMFREFIFLPRP